MQSSQRATQSRLISAKVCGLKCVEVFYFMENFKKSEFRLSTRKNGIEDRVWFTTGAGTETEDWTRALVEINVDDRTCYQVRNMLQQENAHFCHFIAVLPKPKTFSSCCQVESKHDCHSVFTSLRNFPYCSCAVLIAHGVETYVSVIFNLSSFPTVKDQLQLQVSTLR